MRKQYFVFLMQLLLTIIFAVLSILDNELLETIENSSFKYMLSYLLGWKLYLIVLITILLTGISGSDRIFFPKKYSCNIRQAVMSTIIEEFFDNNARDIRVTIFKDATFWVNLWFNIKSKVFNWFTKEKSNNGKWGKFIVVKERFGLEYPKSRTYFNYSSQTREDCQGIAGIVRHNLVSLRVDNLPDIESVNLDGINVKGRTLVEKNVREYMKRAYVKDLRTLKRLNKRARHFYGDVLFDSNGQPKGVFIVDSFQDITPLTADKIERLKYYIKIIGATL